MKWRGPGERAAQRGYTHTCAVIPSYRRTRPEPPSSHDALAPCARSVAADADLQLEAEPDTAPGGAARGAAAAPPGDADDSGQSAVRTGARSDPLARGRSDRAAVRRRHHDAALHARWTPGGTAAAAIFDALETERIEALGARRLKGVGSNLDRLRDHERAGAFGAIDVIADATRMALRDIEAASASALESTGLPDPIAARLRDALPRLREQLDDQRGFARTAKALARALSGDAGDGGGASAGPGDGEDEGAERPPGPADEDAESLDESDTDDDSFTDETAVRDPDEERPPTAQDADALEAEPDTDITDEARDEPPSGGRDPVAPVATARRPGYAPFTTRYDEVRRPVELADPAALAGWRADLDRHIALQGRLVRRLAARLERVLLARQRREWQFDQEEGELDARRLSRVLSSPLSPLAFKHEIETRFRDTTITLLIDNSRSMLGRPITIAAAAADILSRTLERCGVSVEVIGFTTVSLHGGRSSEAWKAAGSPVEPGRLNELRHILYKGADVPYRSARRGFGLMLSREILKQNIDGESLAFAHARLLRRPEQRRVLMVISDGAPVDTATLSANRRDYLARHLHEVIAGIERTRAVQLCAIGIGHDVSRYYRRAMTVHDARELGPAMLAELDSLLREAA